MKILIILFAIVAMAQCWPDFYLFTRNNSNLYHYTSGDLITAPEYKLNKQTIFVIHGYTVNSTAPNIVKVRDALLSYTDLNIIMVDWEKGAASSNFFNPIGYISAGFNGDRVAQDLVLFMKNNNIDPANTYCIGHSMGSHVCGFVGQRVTKKLARITGLDPAGPGFDLLDADHMLSKDDAQFVDTIHTSSLEGSNRPLGQVDFWPNGGQSKEACGLVNFSCEHHFAELLFAETVKGGSCKFTAVSCKSYLHFKLGMCSCKNSLCSSMGYYSDKSARGNYYLDTNANSPYCKK